MPLHPKIAAILKATAHLPRPPQIPVDVARKGFRERIALLPPAPDAIGPIRELELPGRAGPIRARSYRPAGPVEGPLVVFFHGGGFVLGDLETHDGLCRRLCARARCPMLAIDYRLAPEHPFPAAVEDCWDALVWAAGNAAGLGARGSALALAGDSAGGTLAASIARRCREEGGPAICAQALMYPALGHYSCAPPSYSEMASGFGLTREAMVWYWDRYLQGADHGDPRAVPLSSTDFARLPPTLVVTAEYDVLRDEGERYADALKAAGVEARASRYAGMNHGFIGLAGIVEQADQALEEVSRWLVASCR